MTKAIFIAAFLFSFFTAQAQIRTECDTASNPLLMGNSFSCRWKFYALRDTLRGTVMVHQKHHVACGIEVWASVTVIRTQYGDTLRVIDLCNVQDYQPGEPLWIAPAAAPAFQVNIPARQDWVNKEKRKYYLRTNVYDEGVMTTAWGELFRPSELELYKRYGIK